jgi:hypothetical protein
MDGMNETMRRLIAGKEAWRRSQAALPFHEKIRILVQMQRDAAPILRARGLNPVVWDIEEEFAERDRAKAAAALAATEDHSESPSE